MLSYLFRPDEVPSGVKSRRARTRHGTRVGPVGAHPVSGDWEGALLERWRAQFLSTGSTIHD